MGEGQAVIVIDTNVLKAANRYKEICEYIKKIFSGYNAKVSIAYVGSRHKHEEKILGSKEVGDHIMDLLTTCSVGYEFSGRPWLRRVVTVVEIENRVDEMCRNSALHGELAQILRFFGINNDICQDRRGDVFRRVVDADAHIAIETVYRDHRCADVYVATLDTKLKSMLQSMTSTVRFVHTVAVIPCVLGDSHEAGFC